MCVIIQYSIAKHGYACVSPFQGSMTPFNKPFFNTNGCGRRGRVTLPAPMISYTAHSAYLPAQSLGPPAHHSTRVTQSGGGVTSHVSYIQHKRAPTKPMDLPIHTHIHTYLIAFQLLRFNTAFCTIISTELFRLSLIEECYSHPIWQIKWTAERL